jgi:uncharacterized phiE125 gp8 family phage protein
MGLALATAPASEPLTLAEAKAHLRVDATDENDLITALIVAAREYCEGYLHRKLITQAWDWTLCDFPACFQFPFLPVSAVTSIKYYDTANALQTLSSSYYQVDLNTTPARIHLAYGYAWPSTYERSDAVVVRFAVGYANAAAVPQSIKQAMYLLIGHWFRSREAANVGASVTEIPMGGQALLFPLRLPGF